MNVKKLKARLTHRGSHVVFHPFQCTGTLFTFTRVYWNFTSNLQRNINIDFCSANSVLERNPVDSFFFSSPFTGHCVSEDVPLSLTRGVHAP